MGTFNLAHRIDVKSNSPNIDYLYGPYNSLSEANQSIPAARRALGRTVGIIQDGEIVEYWYKDGIEDNNLTQKLVKNGEVIENEITFVSESVYQDLAEHGQLNPDLIYFTYEDE